MIFSSFLLGRNNEMIKHPVLNQFCVIVNESVEEVSYTLLDAFQEMLDPDW